MVATACGGSSGTTSSGSIRIAVFGPMTGIYAATGKQIWTGAKLAGDDINAAGGVLGMKLELVQTDDQETRDLERSPRRRSPTTPPWSGRSGG